jgi:hypothetical protein
VQALGAEKEAKIPDYTDYNWIYILQMFLFTSENLTPSEIEKMDCKDWDLYLEISQNYSKGVKFKQKLEEQKAKSKK